MWGAQGPGLGSGGLLETIPGSRREGAERARPEQGASPRPLPWVGAPLGLPEKPQDCQPKRQEAGAPHKLPREVSGPRRSPHMSGLCPCARHPYPVRRCRNTGDPGGQSPPRRQAPTGPAHSDAYWLWIPCLRKNVECGAWGICSPKPPASLWRSCLPPKQVCTQELRTTTVL